MPPNPTRPHCLFEEIAPARTMQISLLDFNNGTLRLTAPLEPNRNDKGTAFAGSIASILALTGWGLVMLRLKEAGIQADVALANSKTDYKCPVRAEMITKARLESIDPLIRELQETGRGRIHVEIQLHAQETLCAVMTAQYAVFPGKTS